MRAVGGAIRAPGSLPPQVLCQPRFPVHRPRPRPRQPQSSTGQAAAIRQPRAWIQARGTGTVRCRAYPTIRRADARDRSMAAQGRPRSPLRCPRGRRGGPNGVREPPPCVAKDARRGARRRGAWDVSRAESSCDQAAREFRYGHGHGRLEVRPRAWPGRCAYEQLHMPRALVVLAAAALVTAGSCIKHIPKDAIPPVVCASGEYLEVVNETGQRVDVYALRGASMLMLGTIGAGRSTLALPNNSAISTAQAQEQFQFTPVLSEKAKSILSIVRTRNGAPRPRNQTVRRSSLSSS
jgi:hypothetical protein